MYLEGFIIKLSSGESQLKLETPSLDTLQSLLVHLKKHMNTARMSLLLNCRRSLLKYAIAEQKKYDGKDLVFPWVDYYLAQPGMLSLHC
jgi:hypothetical protein